MKLTFLQKEDASDNILLVMISAIFSLLFTRLFLQVTNFPQIRIGEWHIAHVIFGGILMILSTLLTASFYGKKIRHISLVVFGLGVGLFIDEVGKFLSIDNDYFFQPAISLIYVFFILGFLFYWYLSKNKPTNNKTHLYNAINKFEEVIEADLQKSEKDNIIKNLNQAIKHANPTLALLAKQLKIIIQTTDDLADKRHKRINFFWNQARNIAYKLFKKKLSLFVLYLISLAYSVSAIFDFILLVGNQSAIDSNLFWLKTISDLLSSFLFLIAILTRLAKKTKLSLILFQYGLLVNIFLSQIFKFYFRQFQALLGLIISIVVYFGLKRLRQERLI